MVRNEQDIIEPFLRHNAPLVDLLIVLDNRSTDNTRSIAVATARDLGNVVIVDLPDRAYNQSTTMSRMLRLAQSTGFARFVFFLDADEFLSASSRQALSEHLARIPSGGSGLMPWKTFVPDPRISESDAPDPLDRLTLCRKLEEPQYYKSVLRLDGAFDPRLTVGQGNHTILDAKGRELPSLILDDLPLLHFPLRSADQLLVKGYLGWLANQARPKRNRRRRQGLQWKHLHDIAMAGKTLDADRLTQEAVDYIQHRKGLSFQEATISLRHNVKVSRRHSDGRFMSASSLISASTTDTDPRSFRLPAPANARAETTTVENAFDTAWHWDHLFLDEPFIRAAIDLLDPKSILDLGCGVGLYPLLYRHYGVEDVLGVDGLEPGATALDASMYVKADLQLPFDSGRKFDLVVCLEVVEHLHPETTDVILDSISRHAANPGTIMFSMAEPGQPGNGHINCRTISEVLDLWANRGWFPDVAQTLGLRAIASMSWFRRNTLILRRGSGDSRIDLLRRIGQMPFIWYGQAPGHRKVALDEPFPNRKSAYGIRPPLTNP
jgi:SAM-dependent methyltransferase/glycosyltransferase involved in cell wall biosynthesis